MRHMIGNAPPAGPAHRPRTAWRVSAVCACAVTLLLSIVPGRAASAGRMALVAVFPVENLSGDEVPTDEIRQALLDALAAEGVAVLADDAQEAFLARHRVRYTAGIDRETARVLAEEERVDGVLVASVELSNPIDAPKVALTARLVSIDDVPTVAWADDVGLAGDDAPGLFGLGVVVDYGALQARALARLVQSLRNHVRTGETVAPREPASKFSPRTAYRGALAAPGTAYSVAVLPFFNLTPRRGAGDVMALLFMRHLSASPHVRVLDAGDVREQLLRARVIMEGGISIADADVVGSVLEADYVLAGRVLDYRDFDGADAVPRVEFSTVLIERATRRVVWSSQSDNAGDDGVVLFGRGATRTAHAMATQMVRITSDMITGADR
jgi:TolB-like protein